MYLGRFIANGQRSINRDFDLKKRKYIGTSLSPVSPPGPTSTCAELAFLMSNQVQSRKGAVMWDCFAGWLSWHLRRLAKETVYLQSLKVR